MGGLSKEEVECAGGPESFQAGGGELTSETGRIRFQRVP